MIIGAVFYKTIFLGQPVSRICLVAAKDVIFRQFLAPATEIYYDESASQLFVPYKFLTSIYLSNNWLPLWNPYAGCGTPFLADIQSYALSPWTLLFSIMPTMRWLNLLIPAQVVAAAFGTYALTRVLGASVVASVLASLCYSLCPRQLEWTELLSASLLPLVFFAFTMVSKHTSKIRIIAAAVSCTALLVSAHPEISFIGISHASLLLLLLNILKKTDGHSLIEKVIRTGFTLATIGVLTFALSAPVLLTFAEFLANSESYKFDSTRHVDSAFYWQWFIFNLFQPADRGDSPFLGAITPLLIAPSLTKGSHRYAAISLLITASSAFILGCRPGLVGTLLFDTALNFNGTYYLTVILLMLCSGAAIGLDRTSQAIAQKDRKTLLLLLLSSLILLAAPLVIDLIPALKTSFQHAIFRTRDLINNLCVLVGVLIILILSLKKLMSVRAFTLGLTALSIISVITPARYSLPRQGDFEYKQEGPLAFLMKNPGRSLGVSWDVLRPSSNLAYQISTLSTINVLFPSRYRSFMKAAGAEVSTFNVLMVQPTLSHLLDVASVKYIISLAPISAKDKPKEELETIDISQAKVTPNLHDIEARLLQAKITFDQPLSQFSGTLTFNVPSKQSKQYAFNVIVTDEQDNQIWFGGINAIPTSGRQNADGNLVCEVPFAGIVPYHLPKEKKVLVGIKIFDAQTLRSNQGVTKICSIDRKSTTNQSADNHYKLIEEFPPHHVRIYENQRALPRAYVVHKVHICQSSTEALNTISGKDFDYQKTVTIEGVTPSQLVNTSANFSAEPAAITKDSPDNLSIEVDNQSAGILILTDVFYPGWKALVDGKEVPIYRANYLFRGVLLPAGKHTIEFSYFPSSFIIGLTLSIIASALMLAITFYELFRKPVSNSLRPNSSSVL